MEGGETSWRNFFTLGNWRRFCLYLNNQHSHGKMEHTGGFTALNWSKTNPPCLSDCTLLVLYRRRRSAGGIFCSHGTLEMFTCTSTVQPILPRYILILRLTMGLSRWFAGHSFSCPQTLLFAWCNQHFPSNLAVCPPVLWKVFPFNSHKATGSVSIS
jgi:hypothetical protein